MQQTVKSPVATVFLTVFLDMLGVGIIIPVLPALFMSAENSILPPEMSHAERSILYGYLVAAYPIMQFFGAPVLGALSDRYGRKPMIQLSLLGTFVGYLLFGWAILTKNLPLLFISRMLPGFTGGNISIIMSALSDIATPENRTKYFGLVGMAFGLGFILGPAIGGVLADSSVVSWFDHATPFWFTAGLTLLNLAVAQFLFRETLSTRRASEVSFGAGWRNVRRAFASPNLRDIFTVSLLISLGFSAFTQFFAVFLIQKFGIAEKEVGFIFGWVGVWLVFTQGFTVRRMAARFAPAAILRWSLLLLAASMAAVILPPTYALFFWVNPFIATFQGLSSPNITTLVSTSANADEQGEVLGINQSMISVGQALPPIVAGYLNGFDGRLPILFGALFVLLGWAVFVARFGKMAKA